MSSLEHLISDFLSRSVSYVWQNRTWLFDGVGVVIALGVLSGLRELFFRKKKRSPASTAASIDRGHRFEFADGVVAFAKLRGTWELVDIFKLHSRAKDQDEFTRKIAPLIHARAAYRLEKYSYAEAKDKRREVELALVHELAPDFASYGATLTGITIGTFVRDVPEPTKEKSSSIPLGTQTKNLRIETRGLAVGAASVIELLVIYRVTNPYKFLYAAVDGPYSYIQPLIESEVRYEVASATALSVISNRQALEERLLSKLNEAFAFVGLTLDSVRLLDAR